MYSTIDVIKQHVTRGENWGVLKHHRLHEDRSLEGRSRDSESFTRFQYI